jgi:hypothetical protein
MCSNGSCSIGNGKYVSYNDKEQLNMLDMNYIPNQAETLVFPRSLYSGDLNSRVMPAKPYACSVPRDSEVMYLYPNERKSHPDFNSHFSYTTSPYNSGYGGGIMPGKYDVALTCMFDQQPANMAPSHLYPQITYNSEPPRPAYVKFPFATFG